MAGQHEKIDSWMDPKKFMWGPSRSTEATPQQAQFESVNKSQGLQAATSDARMRNEMAAEAQRKQQAEERKMWQEKAQSLGVGEDQNFWDWLKITLGIK